MKQLRNITLALYISATALSAQSADNEVFITSKGYFPEVIYMNVGDTIKFENMSGRSARIRYYSNGWVDLMPWTSNNASRTITMTSSILNKISNALPAPQISSNNGYYTANNGAQLSFVTAPDECPSSENRILC